MYTIDEMKALVKELNDASKAYYQEDREIMSNYDYDRLYDQLQEMEKALGTVLSNSPTIKVGYEILSQLPRETHESPMLSLDKTKDSGALKSWLGHHTGVLSWKMDGLTIVLTYENGSLIKAVTRGNGEVGEVITGNARVFKNIPHHIAYKGNLVLRGEAVIKYSDFNAINAQIEDVDAKYKNPRNLCSGSVRQLNNEITAKRNVYFFAFGLVSAPLVDFKNSRNNQFQWLSDLGFDVVEYVMVNEKNIEAAVMDFAGRISDNDFPSDGLVLILDDIAYSASLGTTAKFPRDSMAFKWADELRETTLEAMEWSASRTGLINPVAIFTPVELEGTTVSRASVHNLSIVESLRLGIGDVIEVYKANMIIPQIAQNLTQSDTLEIPTVCPVCHGPVEISQVNDVKALYCINPDCQAKKIKMFAHFVSRDAFNVVGLSEATLEKFIQEGFIKTYADIFKLERYHEEIASLEGFGEKSYAKLIEAVNTARRISLPKLIYSLGILNVGLSNAKLLCKAYKQDFEALKQASVEDLTDLDGIGQVIAESFVNYFKDADHQAALENLMEEITLYTEAESQQAQIFEGQTFVITGSLIHYANRNELKAVIEALGGKVAGSVSSKTTYLINNDAASGSSKNKKARELGVEIITEEDFIKKIDV